MNLDNQNSDRNLRKKREGVVVSDCQDKTIVVEVTRLTSHKLYKKVIKLSKKYYAHDEDNKAKIGDKVIIAETRPLSKTKRWRLVSIHGQSE
jgi:small subunit ribosomal protein S17